MHIIGKTELSVGFHKIKESSRELYFKLEELIIIRSYIFFKNDRKIILMSLGATC